MKQEDLKVVRSSHIILHRNIVDTPTLVYGTIIAIIQTFFV